MGWYGKIRPYLKSLRFHRHYLTHTVLRAVHDVSFDRTRYH